MSPFFLGLLVGLIAGFAIGVLCIAEAPADQEPS